MELWINCWHSLDEISEEELIEEGEMFPHTFIGLVFCNEDGVKYAKMVFTN